MLLNANRRNYSDFLLLNCISENLNNSLQIVDNLDNADEENYDTEEKESDMTIKDKGKKRKRFESIELDFGGTANSSIKVCSKIIYFLKTVFE